MLVMIGPDRNFNTRRIKLEPAHPHNPIEQIGDDLFFVHGSIKVNPLVQLSRNMAIVRQNDELTLINPVRLVDAELKQLDALGMVKNVMRLGAAHGCDDQFYMDRYKPSFWCQAEKGFYQKPAIDHVLAEGSNLPFDGAKLFCFKNTAAPESAILLEQQGGTLLTCDAVQHYGEYSNINLVGRIILPRIGFPKTTVIGPFWLKKFTPDGSDLKSEFDRLLELEFDSLLAAHGTFLKTGAKAAVTKAISKAFPQ